MMATITRMKEQIAELEARVAELEKAQQAKPARAAAKKADG